MFSEGQFVWYDLTTTDMDAAKAFYCAVMGWECVEIPNAMPDGGSYYLFKRSGVEANTAGMMALPKETTNEELRPVWTGYVAVDNVDGMARNFSDGGGSIVEMPEDIPNVGRIASVADAHGATLCVAKFLQDEEMPDMPEFGAPGSIGWNELFAGNAEEAMRFYSTMFGWRETSTMDMGSMGIYHLFAHGERDIGGMMTKPHDRPTPFWNYYFAVEALDAAAEAVKTHGGTLLREPAQVPGGTWVVQATDPQGAFFSLMAEKR
jgi:predicted enzyme related to lactoylglutathione lyase